MVWNLRRKHPYTEPEHLHLRNSHGRGAITVSNQFCFIIHHETDVEVVHDDFVSMSSCSPKAKQTARPKL
ncbi:hypothetical protein T11_2278 [Trichinella zimbabwensis]|uniref:Uncharacterized protein n=1 Tax=Trichinella zimbabwensis TaxID=268475 RepID=A0A0V1GIP2_9BILA|nr:hypothetical protein T11_2278 [Trichinella zimbabwensis]